MQTYYLSLNGYRKLRQRRKEIAASIEAKKKQMGESVSIDNDLRENPEFMQLRTDVTYVLPRRLNEIDIVLSSCQIIEDLADFINSKFDKVQLGAKVTVKYEDGTVVPFIILGYNETDIDTDVISYLSPTAQGLLGKSAGETVEIKVPERTIKIKILSVEKGI